MDHKEYEVSGVDQLITPTLFYYKDNEVENIPRAIQIAGYPKRLRPHVKSHKTRELVHLQMDQGITRF